VRAGYILSGGMLRVNSRMNAGVWTATTDGHYCEPVPLDDVPTAPASRARSRFASAMLTRLPRSAPVRTPHHGCPARRREVQQTGRDVVIELGTLPRPLPAREGASLRQTEGVGGMPTRVY